LGLTLEVLKQSPHGASSLWAEAVARKTRKTDGPHDYIGLDWSDGRPMDSSMALTVNQKTIFLIKSLTFYRISIPNKYLTVHFKYSLYFYINPVDVYQNYVHFSYFTTEVHLCTS
jgi:hypothetical protein